MRVKSIERLIRSHLISVETTDSSHTFRFSFETEFADFITKDFERCKSTSKGKSKVCSVKENEKELKTIKQCSRGILVRAAVGY